MRHGGMRVLLAGAVAGALALGLTGCVTPEPQPGAEPSAHAGRTPSGASNAEHDDSEDFGDDDGHERGTRSLTPWTPSPEPTWSPPASALWEAGTRLVTSPKGAFSAVAPRTWRSAPCPVAGTDCLRLVPAGAPSKGGLFVGGTGNGVEGNPADAYCWLPRAGLLMGGGGVRTTTIGGYRAFRLDLSTRDGEARPGEDVVAVACVPVPGAGTLKGPGSVLPVLVECDALGSPALHATCERVAATVGMPELRARPGR